MHAAVGVVVPLNVRIHAHAGLEGIHRTVGFFRLHGQFGRAAFQTGEVTGLSPIQLEAGGAFTVNEVQRQHTPPHQIRAVNPLEALGNHRLHPQQQLQCRLPAFQIEEAS